MHLSLKLETENISPCYRSSTGPEWRDGGSRRTNQEQREGERRENNALQCVHIL